MLAAKFGGSIHASQSFVRDEPGRNRDRCHSVRCSGGRATCVHVHLHVPFLRANLSADLDQQIRKGESSIASASINEVDGRTRVILWLRKRGKHQGRCVGEEERIPGPAVEVVLRSRGLWWWPERLRCTFRTRRLLTFSVFATNLQLLVVS